MIKRRILTAAVCLSVLLFAIQVEARTKVDPFLGVSKSIKAFKALSINKSFPEASEEEFSDVFIKTVDTEATAETVASLGGKVRTRLTNLITASLPSSAIDEIADQPETLFIESSRPLSVTNDIAGEEVGASEVHAGTYLPTGYTGNGVIVGIVDTGVDYRHADFKDSEGRSRVLAIWDQSKQYGNGPSEISSTYGTECDSDEIAAGTCPLTDYDGHGTHVAGIAAGNHSQYKGIAPNANIIVVKYDARLDLESGYADTIFSTKICEAAYYVFTKAEQYGMPAVINMSLGTHIGAHDGKSLFEECLNELTSGAGGRAMVAAAGNEYSEESDFKGIHTGFDLSNREKASNFAIRYPTSDGIYYLDIWGSQDSDITLSLALHNGTPSGEPYAISNPVGPGDTKSGSFLDGKITYTINATDTESALNGKPHIGVTILVDPSVTNISDFSFDMIIKGSGSFDAWLFPDKPAKTVQFTSVNGSRDTPWTYVAGDSKKSIAIPSTSPNVLSVSGYATRTRWTLDSLTWVFNGQQLGELLGFSSAGPSAEPSYTGQKPEIAAPGGMIASAKSSQATVGAQVLMDDGQHFLQAGTSMAAPFVTGAIALIFETNPNFTQADIRNILIQSAYQDASLPLSLPNDRWGYGKLDVLKAVETALDTPASGVFDASGSLTSPNSSSSDGKSSCTLASEETSPVRALDIALALFLLAGLITRRVVMAARN